MFVANAGVAQKVKSETKNEPLAISNENFRFSPEKSEAEILLRSPVESHFAMTPVTQSSSNSPANGFTSEDCTDILCQELEKLDKEQEHILSVEKSNNTNNNNNNKPADLKLDLVTVESIMSPTEENISMFTIEEKITDQKIEESKVEEEEVILPGEVIIIFLILIIKRSRRPLLLIFVFFCGFLLILDCV